MAIMLRLRTGSCNKGLPRQRLRGVKVEQWWRERTEGVGHNLVDEHEDDGGGAHAAGGEHSVYIVWAPEQSTQVRSEPLLHTCTCQTLSSCSAEEHCLYQEGERPKCCTGVKTVRISHSEQPNTGAAFRS